MANGSVRGVPARIMCLDQRKVGRQPLEQVEQGLALILRQAIEQPSLASQGGQDDPVVQGLARGRAEQRGCGSRVGPNGGVGDVSARGRAG